MIIKICFLIYYEKSKDDMKWRGIKLRIYGCTSTTFILYFYSAPSNSTIREHSADWKWNLLSLNYKGWNAVRVMVVLILAQKQRRKKRKEEPRSNAHLTQKLVKACLIQYLVYRNLHL